MPGTGSLDNLPQANEVMDLKKKTYYGHLTKPAEFLTAF